MNIEKLQEGVLCSLMIGKWNASAKVKTEKLSKKAPDKIFRIMQSMLDDRSILDKMIAIQNKARYLLETNSLPFPVQNLYFIPKHKIEELDNQFKDCQNEYFSARQELIEHYSELKKDFQDKYSEYIDPAFLKKYPDKEELKTKFTFGWNFFQFTIPNQKMGILPASVYKKEKEKFEKMMEEMNSMAIEIVGNSILEKVRKLKEQCKNGEVHGRTFNAVSNLLDKWEDMWVDNIDNEKIKSSMNKLKSEMKKIKSIETFRDSSDMQEKLTKVLNVVINRTKEEMASASKRKLDI